LVAWGKDLGLAACAGSRIASGKKPALALRVKASDVIIPKYKGIARLLAELNEEEEDWGDSLLERIARPLSELVEDIGGPSTVFTGILTLVVGPCLHTAGLAAAAHPGLSIVVMSAVPLTLRGILPMVGLLGAMATGSLWHRHPEVKVRVMQHCTSLASGLCVGYQFWLAATGGFPAHVASWLVHPDLVAHCLLDLACGPPIILSLGYLAGQRARDMLPTVAFTAAGHLSWTAAAAASGVGWSVALFGVGCLFIAEGLSHLTHNLPDKASAIGTQGRTQMAADLVAFSWVCQGATQIFGLLHLADDSLLLPPLIAGDVLGKWGVGHIILKEPEVVAAVALSLASAEEETAESGSRAAEARRGGRRSSPGAEH